MKASFVFLPIIHLQLVYHYETVGITHTVSINKRAGT